MKIAISGHKGFIGKHLLNSLIFKLNFNKKDIILIEKEDFNDLIKLRSKILNCSILFHLAAINRHPDSEFLHSENIRLTNSIINSSAEKTQAIIFASSTQQDKDSPFGTSKLKCSQLFTDWAKKNNKNFINLKIPNVFGPFGKPNYNSFIATFCNNIILNKKCKINSESTIDLIYIDDLISEISSSIDFLSKNSEKNNILEIENFKNIETISVKKVFNILESQWNVYKSNTMPDTKSKFHKDLFNTLRSFINHEKFFPKKLIKHGDNRGFFSEIIRTQGKGQFSLSTSHPGIVRGNHFHTHKIERFIVVQGKALVELRRIDSNIKFSFELNGDDLEYIDIPVWYTHKIKNIGDDLLLTLFWIDEPYNSNDSDTYLINT